MKKILPILAGLLAAAGLAGCDGGKAGDEVFKKCLDKTLAVGASDILPGFASAIDGDQTPDKGSFLKLTTKQTIIDTDVSIEWDLSKDEDKIYKRWAWDETHDALEMNFPAVGEEDDSFEFTIKSMTAGNVTKNHDELVKIYGDELDYKVVLTAGSRIYDELTIKELTDLNDTGDGYYTVDYSDKTNIYFKKPHNQDYWYSTIKGKVLYMSPDFNWGIIGDGDRYTQLYFGGTDASRQNNFPELKAGNYVEVRGNIGAYQGNHQFTFINRVRKINKSEITEPSTDYVALTEDKISSFILPSGSHEYVIEGFMNSLASVTGTYVAGSLKKQNSSKALNAIADAEARHTFQMKVGEQTIKIAYDYHVVDEGETVATALNKIFSSTSTFEIKGCIRYEGSTMANTKGNGDGEWTLVPYFAEGISQK